MSSSALAGGGGVTIPDPPQVRDALCLDQCVGMREATEGSKVELTGKRLGSVEQVSFKAEQGRIKVDPASVSGKRVKAHVPEGAVHGKPRAISGAGNSTSPVQIKVRPKGALPDDGEFELQESSVTNPVGFYAGKRKPTVNFVFSSDEPVDVRIDVVKRQSGGKIIRSFTMPNLQPFSSHSLTWNVTRDNGRPAPNGKYVFKLGPVSARTSAPKDGSTKFKAFKYHFPLPARHQYGDGPGAGRGHQGQDVFARCDKPVKAARGGIVEHRSFQGSAGYYIVIDGKGTGKDYFYAHLRRRGRAKEGSFVKTGQRIGFNGATGNASGCHLHFEIWSAPGWYQGGRPTNPAPPLRKWDSWS